MFENIFLVCYKKEKLSVNQDRYIVLELKNCEGNKIFAQIFETTRLNDDVELILYDKIELIRRNHYFFYVLNEINKGDFVKVDLALIKNYKDIEWNRIEKIEKIYISKPITNEEHIDVFIKALNFTEWEINIAVPYFNNIKHIFTLLKKIAQEGKKVIFITTSDNLNHRQQREILDSLEKMGVDVYLNERLHSKIYLFDNLLVKTSANWTYNGFLNHHEDGDITNDESKILAIKKHFRKIISESFLYKKPFNKEHNPFYESVY